MHSFMCVWCTRHVMAWVNAEAVEDTGVPAIILGLICLRWCLTDRGVRLVPSKPQRSSCSHLTVCGNLFIYILILLIFIYVSVWVCLLVCVCISSTPLEPSSSGSDTCRKNRVAGRTGITSVPLLLAEKPQRRDDPCSIAKGDRPVLRIGIPQRHSFKIQASALSPSWDNPGAGVSN